MTAVLDLVGQALDFLVARGEAREELLVQRAHLFLTLLADLGVAEHDLQIDERDLRADGQRHHSRRRARGGRRLRRRLGRLCGGGSGSDQRDENECDGLHTDPSQAGGDLRRRPVSGLDE